MSQSPKNIRQVDGTLSEAPVDETALRGMIDTMELGDKIRMLSGAAQFALVGDPDLSLAPMVLSDGPTGVRGPVVVGGRNGCLLPNASLLAQTWDPQLLADVGGLLADEAEFQETHIVLGPTINLHRTPLNGRMFESFSEDPYLTGVLAAAYMNALQERGIGSSLKHWVGNESETERTTVDIRMDPTTLRELYLKAFEIAVQDGSPWTVMAAYNLVNGVPSTEHEELMAEVLKGEWGYDGVILSDWYATSSSVESAEAGLDLVMPGPETPWSRSLQREVEEGRVSEELIDQKVFRILRLGARVGALGEPRTWQTDLPSPESPERADQLTELAARGMVVLRNERQTLPLKPGDGGRTVVVGRHAIDTIAQGGGSAQVRPPHMVSIADGLREELGGRIDVIDGVETRQVLPAAPVEMVVHPESGQPGTRLRTFDAHGDVLHDLALDSAELEDGMTGWLADVQRIEFSARVVIDEPQELQIGVRGPGDWHLRGAGVDERFRIDYHDGPGGGFFRPRSHAMTTRVSPGDVLTATVDRDEMPRLLGLVIAPARVASATAISRAAAAAQSARTAIVVVGNTPDQETEGQDQQTLALPGDQDALVAAVAGVAERTVVVVNAATPVMMPWLNDVDAVVFIGLPGQESGHAVAAALTGRILPEGRLVTTFPAADGMGPAWSTTPVDGVLSYEEGVFMGYRGWLELEEEPAFWFGHGLGLTTWDYSSARATWDGEAPTHVQVEVSNTGQHDGIETVQVYFRPDAQDRPTRLIGWGQIRLGPQERGELEIQCDPRMQVRWDDARSCWQPLGPGTVLVGRSPVDVRDRLRASDGQERLSDATTQD